MDRLASPRIERDEMSLHNKPKYQIPELIESLKAHGLDADKPSQLSDAFRTGWVAALAALRSMPAEPVAWGMPDPETGQVYDCISPQEHDFIAGGYTIPLYATPHTAPVLSEACEWSLEDEDNGIWQSSCGELWSFTDGGPKENRVSFCHHCGKPAIVRAAAALAGDTGEAP